MWYYLYINWRDLLVRGIEKKTEIHREKFIDIQKKIKSKKEIKRN